MMPSERRSLARLGDFRVEHRVFFQVHFVDHAAGKGLALQQLHLGLDEFPGLLHPLDVTA